MVDVVVLWLVNGEKCGKCGLLTVVFFGEGIGTFWKYFFGVAGMGKVTATTKANTGILFLRLAFARSGSE
ncbi:MAG TPA: hypothetical protein VIX90_00300 [Edaphobacter sp.]